MTLVSVVIPMRNAERFVAETLRSVLAQAGQGEAYTLEVVVVDDGSTDRSAEVVLGLDDPRVRMIPGPRRGISAAFNAGLATARGQVLTRCDADDLYPPDRIQWQVRWLAERPEFAAVCGYYSVIDDDGAMITDRYHNHPAGDVTGELRGGAGRSHMCAYAFRTEALRTIGGCREWFMMAEDADLQFRLAEVARIGFEPRPAYLYRLHEASITHQVISPKRKFFEQMCQRFREQRARGEPDDLQRGSPPPVPMFDKADARPRQASEQIQDLLIARSWQDHAAGRKRRALAIGVRACLRRPLTVNGWKNLAALVLKRAPAPAP